MVFDVLVATQTLYFDSDGINKLYENPYVRIKKTRILYVIVRCKTYSTRSCEYGTMQRGISITCVEHCYVCRANVGESTPHMG